MSQKQYGVALIGCGSMGEVHLDDIVLMDNIRIECVCDLDEDKAQSFKKKYRANRLETDWKLAIASDDVDIVIIATYPSTHLEILEECIRLNKHVLCEKPITNDLESGRKFCELVKKNPKTKVLVGYILRHNKTYQTVAKMIQDGAIGFPIVMRMAQNHHTMDWNKYLKLIDETSPIIDCGVHYIDVMQWFTGARVTEVSGIGLKTEPDVPDGKYNYGLMTAKLSDGSIAYYEAGWSNTISSNNLKEFVGPKGRITITYQTARFEHQEEGDLIEYYTYPDKHYEFINLQSKRKPTAKQLEKLIAMIETDSVASPTIDDVMSSFEWAVRADEIIKNKL